MAVVGVALAVERDQALVVLLRPEDVVREEAVAVVRGLLGDLRRADRAVPHERRDAVERTGGRGEALQRGAELALPVDDVLTPQPVQQVVVLERERQALTDVLAEPGVDRAGVAAADHQVDASAGQMLEHREVLGDLHRVVRRDERRRGREHEALGLGGDVGERRRGRRRPERRVVVLADGEDVESDGLGVLGDRDGVADLLRFARRPTGRRVLGDVAHREDAELHLGCDVVHDRSSRFLCI